MSSPYANNERHASRATLMSNNERHASRATLMSNNERHAPRATLMSRKNGVQGNPPYTAANRISSILVVILDITHVIAAALQRTHHALKIRCFDTQEYLHKIQYLCRYDHHITDVPALF